MAWNGHPNAFPPVAQLAVASQAFSRSSPYWQSLSKYFPGNCCFGGRFLNVSPAAATQEDKKVARESLRLMLLLNLHMPQHLLENPSSYLNPEPPAPSTW